MSILNFSNRLFSKSIENSSETIPLGSFTNDTTLRQLGNIRIKFFFDGLFTGSTITLSVTDSLTSPTFTWNSDSVTISDIDPILGTDSNWLGWVRFDFDKQWLDASTEYHLYIGATGYTETESKSINMVYDYPVPIYGSRQDFYYQHPVAMQIFGYERT